jgi:glycine dehydrogenase
MIDFERLQRIRQTYPDILLACNADLMSLSFYEPSDEFDFVFGNGTNFGIGLNYGGPQPAFLASKTRFLRQLPGKIVSTAKDIKGKDCYRLALQTREQHIKREKATSNICTNQALLANMSVAWTMAHGPDGIQRIGKKIYEKTQHFYIGLQKMGIHVLNDTFFNTLSISPKQDLHQKLEAKGIFCHFSNSHMSFTIDETHTYDDLDYTLDHIKRCSESSFSVDTKNMFPKKNIIVQPYKRSTNLFDDSVLNQFHRDEQGLMRYLFQLANKDYSLMNGLIPLGSCTMKHTPSESMETITNQAMNIHPYIPLNVTPYQAIVDRLSQNLKDITGFDAVFFQSQSGAMGEYAGLTTIRNYHSNCLRKYIIMPKSAHGTNASSAKLAGFDILHVKETSHGMIDIEHLKELLEIHEFTVAGLMITYPSTYGLYEENAKMINRMIHDVGGLVYMDGANMNALLGKTPKVAELGFDLCHFNLHKTFAVPHGGGGPGMGPIAVNRKLTNHLPSFSTTTSCKSISTTEHGSGLILQISERYLQTLNHKALHDTIIYQTRSIISRLSEKYTILHKDNENRAHEFIIDVAMFKSRGITELDISKRLMDYGFHAPTMSWPVSSSLMIEITETETEDEIDRFIEAMLKIYDEIHESPSILKNAPHTQYDVCNWEYDYSIQEACYPTEGSVDKKFWPTVNRVLESESDVQLLKSLLSSKK